MRSSGGRATVRDFTRRLSVLDLNEPSSLGWLVPALRERLDLRFALAYRAGLGAKGWDLDFCFADGVEGAERVLRRWVRRGAPFATYDALHPEPAQRNVVVRVLDVAQPDAHARLRAQREAAQLGLTELDAVRCLVCDGDTLLAWIGGFREAPLSTSEHRFFQALVPHVKRRLIAEHALSACEIAERGLEAAIGRLPHDAFLVNQRGVVQYPNHPGARRSPSELRELAAAVRGGADGRYETTRIPVAGGDNHYLLIRRLGRRAPELVAHAARTWMLTPRQTEVLRCIVDGDQNKTIAERLGCAVSTVEIHVSALLLKARVESRTALAMRVLGA